MKVMEDISDSYYLKPLTESYYLDPTEEDTNVCLTSNHFNLTYDKKDVTVSFIENSYNTLSNNTTLAYEMPGYTRLAFNNGEQVEFLDGRNYDDILQQDIVALMNIFTVANSEASCTYTDFATDIEFNLAFIDFAAYLAETTDEIDQRYIYSFLNQRPEIIHVAVFCRENYTSTLGNPKLTSKKNSLELSQ